MEISTFEVEHGDGVDGFAAPKLSRLSFAAPLTALLSPRKSTSSVPFSSLLSPRKSTSSMPFSSLLSPRKSTSSMPFSSLLSPRKSTSHYSMMPPEPMRLTVIKLDGSSFDIEVMKTADVAELKQAVESAFSHLPQQGAEKISWRHVWGHFCLCYADRNLLTETDYLTNYGIKDGDKLQIVRHFTANYEMEKQRTPRKAGSSSSDEELEEDEDEDGVVQSAASPGCHSYSILPTEDDDNQKSRPRSFSRIRVFCNSIRIALGGL